MKESSPNYDISTPEGIENAVCWQTALISSLKPGGTWAVPRSLSIYNIDHGLKVAYKLCGTAEPDIEKVFDAMGWKVVEKET